MSKFKDGDVCAICSKEWRKGLKFQNHHVSYEKDITVILCYGCHSLLHGSARTYRHPFADKGKDMAPYEFARKLIEVYNNALT